LVQVLAGARKREKFCTMLSSLDTVSCEAHPVRSLVLLKNNRGCEFVFKKDSAMIRSVMMLSRLDAIPKEGIKSAHLFGPKKTSTRGSHGDGDTTARISYGG